MVPWSDQNPKQIVFLKQKYKSCITEKSVMAQSVLCKHLKCYFYCTWYCSNLSLSTVLNTTKRKKWDIKIFTETISSAKKIQSNIACDYYSPCLKYFYLYVFKSSYTWPTPLWLCKVIFLSLLLFRVHLNENGNVQTSPLAVFIHSKPPSI